MSNHFGLTSTELSTARTINPELAAHNIALAYVSSAAPTEKLHIGEDVILDDVLSLSNQYVQAYNFAYSLVCHENEIINHAE